MRNDAGTIRSPKRVLRDELAKEIDSRGLRVKFQNLRTQYVDYGAAKHEAHVQAARELLESFDGDGCAPAPSDGGGGGELQRQTALPAILSKTCSEREAVMWVYDHMGDKNLTTKDAPSPGAWAYLVECQGNQKVKETFYAAVWPKLLPTNKQLEAENARYDDGRELKDLIERVQQATVEAKRKSKGRQN